MQEKEPKIYTKLQAGKKYRIFKTVYKDKVFYKVQLTQKNYDGTKFKVYVNVNFKNNVSLKNETDIIIKTAYQNYRKNPKDDYNWIEYYVITDFEIVESQEQIETQAYEEFRNNLNELESNVEDLFY